VVGASVGLAIGPADGSEPERLLANADTALYRAKSEGRGCFRCFEAEMDLRLRERHALATELRRAIAHDELAVYYQPQIRMASGELIGFEALLRWIHQERGLIPPTTFIPIAEETGQIIALGEWVLRAACREAARWSRPLKIAVNLSTVQFQQPNLPEMVDRILIETGLPAERLEVEITESVLIHDMSRALSILRRLKSLGLRIAMDDFGTGYSSLATLQAFPFDKIKIDRSFVGQLESRPQAAAIVRAVLSLGRSLGIGVVAEGVETEGQVKFLVDEACDEAQGYLYGKPRPIEDFPGLVAEASAEGAFSAAA
jgi:predicted signal transduction protein with EAL and GGDEF domain